MRNNEIKTINASNNQFHYLTVKHKMFNVTVCKFVMRSKLKYMDCSLQKKFTSFCQVQVKSSTVERPSTWTTATGTYIRILQTIFENSFIWRPKRLVTFIGAIQISLSIYLQKKMHTKENWFHVSASGCT